MSKPTNPTVAEMVAAYLREHGFDGLWNDWGGDGCGCDLDNLFPCDELSNDCRAGYKSPCDCEDECGSHLGAKEVEG